MPGVPVGEVVRVDPSGGDLTRTIYVTPFVGFTKLDIVGVVVEAAAQGPARHRPAAPSPKPDAHADGHGHGHPVTAADDAAERRPGQDDEQ